MKNKFEEENEKEEEVERSSLTKQNAIFFTWSVLLSEISDQGDNLNRFTYQNITGIRS